MYSHDGQNLFVIDGHMHFWDANPRIGETNMERAGSNAFTLFTAASARRRKVWPLDKFCRYGEEVLVNDLFRAGYVDMAILNSTYLYEFYNAASRVCASAALKLP